MRALADYDKESLRAEFAGWGCKPAQADRILLEFYRNAGCVDWPTAASGEGSAPK